MLNLGPIKCSGFSVLTLWVPLFSIRIQQVREISFNDYTHANDCSEQRAGKNLAQGGCSLANSQVQHTDDLWTRIYLSELAQPPPSQGHTGNSQVIPLPFVTGHPSRDLTKRYLPFPDVSCSSAIQVIKCVTPACSSRLSTLHIHIEDVFLHLNKVPIHSEVSSCHNFRKLQYYLCQSTVTVIPSHGLRTVYLQMIMGLEGREKLIITDKIIY